MLKKISIEKYLRICLEIILLLLSLGMGFYFQWEVANLVFFLLFVILILHPVSSRFPASGAIMFLVSTAGLLAFKQNDMAETAAIWAYYMMIFTLFMSISELNESESKEKAN